MTFSRVRGVVWASVILLSAGAAVYAFNPQPEPPGHYFGIMTIDAGQHMSLNLANTKMAVDSFRPADTCTARMEIVDACGARLAARSVRIQPGASRSLNFTMPTDQFPPDPCVTSDPPTEITSDPPGDADPPGDLRMHRVRAQIIFSGNASHCVSSLEVGDPFLADPPSERAGGSGFIHPGLIVGFNPQPDPPGAPAKTVR